MNRAHVPNKYYVSMAEPSGDDFVMTYPCYFLLGDGGGLQCNVVDGKDCLCLFTSLEKLTHFRTTMLEQKRPPTTGGLQVGIDTCHNYDELISRLKSGVSELEAAGINYLAIDPVQGQRVLYCAIRDFIEDLPRE